jgi:alpha-glucan, water dikinase
MPEYRIATKSGVDLLVETLMDNDSIEVVIGKDRGEECLLHWGFRRDSDASWQVPPKSEWPEGSRAFGEAALQTPFTGADGKDRIRIKLNRSSPFSFLEFVLFFPEKGRWDNNDGGNYPIPLQEKEQGALEEKGGSDHALMAGEIIRHEVSRNSWTLMHRFNLCHDLLDRIPGGDREGLALLFVWLRFSAIRQLDWQRNYNTQPRELGHALDRLTRKLAGRWQREPRDREWVRLIMGTLGRGADAQRVRDEVLNIMHRHHIKEVSGHFMEEWHQKLHNNTTPDDIVLCEAYLAFLRSDGNLDVFYRTLEKGGVDKARLESYERPIRSDPDFIPHLKGALIHDFEHFLGILKEVHSGTDLGTAIHTARSLFDEEMHRLMDFLWSHREDRSVPLTRLVEKMTDARRLVRNRMERNREGTRDLLFLDMALEDFLRVSVERNLHPEMGEELLVELLTLVLKNLSLSSPDEEMDACLRQWERLEGISPRGREWAMHAESVLERLQRSVGTYIDAVVSSIQPKAEFFGRAVHAESWSIELFSEEIVRGRPPFLLSAMIRRLTPLFRKRAGLGHWQVISPNEAVGTARVVASLASIQTETFSETTILFADKITGNEEIPPGVTGVITSDTTDIVSHLAIRARNAHLLFATCFDPEEMDRLKSMEGRRLKLHVDGMGGVLVEEADEDRESESPGPLRIGARLLHPSFEVFALGSADFKERNVGGKSNNLNRLRNRLPEWIRLPPSAAIPFGVFEKVLDLGANKPVSERYEALTREIGRQTGRETAPFLERIRRTVLELTAPPELITSLRAVMEEEGLGWPENWETTWDRIKRVWASKWNERAYLSRLAYGIPHEDLFMAVLIQQVVQAEYSFVIHTANPFTGNGDEIYTEVVLGLGETLVGNYPGRALSFLFSKMEENLKLLTLPSKSVALFGGGLIFRSDSNGEDLARYAGAGLYDSFMLEPARRVLLDYSGERLLWEENFRDKILTSIALVGKRVEEVLGSPQDIEGAIADGGCHVVQTRPQVGL